MARIPPSFNHRIFSIFLDLDPYVDTLKGKSPPIDPPEFFSKTAHLFFSVSVSKKTSFEALKLRRFSSFTLIHSFFLYHSLSLFLYPFFKKAAVH